MEELTTAQVMKRYLGELTYNEWHSMTPSERRVFALQAAEVMGVKLKEPEVDHV